MAGEVTTGRPAALGAASTRGGRHTRWLLIALYGLAFAWGARNVRWWEPSRLDDLLPLGSTLALGWWAVVDARRRRHPIPLLSRPWFFLAAGFLVPAYILWSRRWAGAGWLALHGFLWNAMATGVMYVGWWITFGSQWLRGLGP